MALHEAHDSCSECGGPLGDAIGAVCADCDENIDEDPTVLAPPAAYLARLGTEDSVEDRVQRRIPPPTPTPAPFADKTLHDEYNEDLPTWVRVALAGLALSVLGAIAVLFQMLG